MNFLGALALTASLLHTFNHTLFKGGLFLGAGAIQYATHTKDIEKLGGLIKKMPVTALFVLCFSLAISAIVPFNGFISEWLTYQALFINIAPGQAGAYYFINSVSGGSWARGGTGRSLFCETVRHLFFRTPKGAIMHYMLKRFPFTMNVGMGILAALCLIIGLFPVTILKLIDAVAFSITGSSVLTKLHGGFLIAYYPLQIAQNSISPLIILIALAVIILFSILTLRLIGGKYIERKYGDLGLRL